MNGEVMNSIYTKVDTQFLNKLNPQVRTKLENLIQHMPEYTIYIMMCLYCNKFYMFPIVKEIGDSFDHARYCVKCGESTPFSKVKYSVKKVRTLHKLSASNAYSDADITNEEIERILLEQCIVNFATGIELFFKEVFAIEMDLKFIKSEHSLFPTFYKDAKNDFLNMGKLNNKFKDELKIDIKSLFSKNTLRELNIIMLKRHAIVHNNGFADKTFIEQSGIACGYGTKIPICSEEIEKCLLTVESIIEKLKREFEQLFFLRLEQKIDIFLPFTTNINLSLINS